MISIVKSLLVTETSRDTSIIFLGTLINVLAGGLFFILAPRILGPTDYGLFSTVLATGILANNLANFGIDTGILRFANNSENSFNTIISLAFKSYVYLGLAVGVIGFFIAGPIANILGQSQLTNLLRIAFGANIFLLLSNFYVAALQAKGEFKKSSIVTFSSNVARLGILVIATYFLTMGLYTMTILFFFITMVSVLFGAVFLPIKFEKTEKNELAKFFRYNFWIALSLIIPSIPFDNYLLVKIAGPLQAGLYAAPFKILTFVYQLGGNFSRVLAPRFASFENPEKAKTFALKAVPLIFIFALGLILLIFLSNPLIRILFGASYLQSAQIMQILAIGFIFFVAAIIPSSIMLYYLGNSRMSFWITLTQTFLFLLLLIILVPQKNAIGASIAFSISQMFTFLASTAYITYKLRHS